MRRAYGGLRSPGELRKGGLVVSVAARHPQILEFARECVAAPAQQVGGVALASGGVFECSFNQCFFKGGYRFAEQLMVTAGQGLIGPMTQGFFPIVGGGTAFFV